MQTPSKENLIHRVSLVFEDRYKGFLPFFLGSILLPLCVFPFFTGWDSSKWVLLYLLSGANFLLIPRKIQLLIPSFTLFQKYILAFLLSSLIFNYFYHNISFLERQSVDRILFWSLFLYYCAILHYISYSEKKYLYVPLFIGTGIFLLLSFFYFIFIDHVLAFTFYNINKSAEYIGFSLALQLGLLASYQGKAQKFFLFLISVSLAYLYFSKCRSASLGVIYIMIYLIWARHLSLKFFLQIIVITGFFITIVEFAFLKSGIFFETLQKGEINFEEMRANLVEKQNSTSDRTKMFFNTASLIRDFPLGIGLGRYEFAVAPYMKNLSLQAFNENFNHIFSPHNEVLRFLSEDGLISCFLMFLFFGSFLFPFQKFRKISEASPETIPFLIFFTFQFLFQFPLIQPFPLFLIPFVLASMVRPTQNFIAFSIPGIQWISRFLGFFFLFWGLGLSASLYISHDYFHDRNLQKFFYQYWKDKEVLETIVFLSYVNKRYNEAQVYSLEGLKKEPQNLYMLKYFGLSAFHMNQFERACPALETYDAAFRGESSVHEKIKMHCF